MRRAIVDGSNVASIFADLGDLDSSMQYMEDVLAKARACGWPHPLGCCLTVLANTMGRLGRNQAAVDEVLGRLRTEAADPNVNLMPTLIEASRTYATLGEMMGAMADVFGRHVEVPTI